MTRNTRSSKSTFDRAAYQELLAAVDDSEVRTHARVRDVALPSGRILALITLDNDRDYKRPNTLGPNSLAELGEQLGQLASRAAAKEIDAVAVTGKRFCFAAGADLSLVNALTEREQAQKLAELGHGVLSRFASLGVPSFAFVNGLALGGGLEIALHCDYRTIDASTPAIALPEVFLGLIPGWGGATLLPNLIGIEGALKVVIENPLKQNRMLKAKDAAELGIVDRMFPAMNFLEESLQFADAVLAGSERVERPHAPGKLERIAKWDIAIGIARKQVREKLGDTPLAPYRALDLLARAKSNNRAAGFAAENEALADLISGDQLRASLYAFDLVQKRAKHPAGSPDPDEAKPVTKVGVIGAGLMATQLATLILRRLQVPIVLTDLDQQRCDRAVSAIREEIDKLASKGRIDSDTKSRLSASVSATTDKSQFADCDLVIEAVFEEVAVKQQVFAEIEAIVAPDAVLATNTSALSVHEIGASLQHPERLVGIHFFNPVAVMPLIEVVRAPATNTVTLATAMDVAKKLKKSAVITADRPGFVVNRILALILGETMHAVENGTALDVADRSLEGLGLPMRPFELLELVGLPVGAHVLDSLHAAFPDRFHRSDALQRLADRGDLLLERDSKERANGYTKALRRVVATAGKHPLTLPQLREHIETKLANEARIMLDEGVVTAAEDLDLCLILGAGFPFQAGGLTPYLDRVGASEQAFGGTFHTPPIRGVCTD